MANKTLWLVERQKNDTFKLYELSPSGVLKILSFDTHNAVKKYLRSNG